MTNLQAVIDRARAEFVEKPGLRMSVVDLQRMCDVDRQIAEMVLEFLADTEFVRRTSMYSRAVTDPPSRNSP